MIIFYYSMCYNKTSSLTIFFFALACSIFLIVRNYPNDRWLATFFIIVSQMQIAEYLMWLDQKCGIINHIGTILGMLILILQPLSLIVGGYYLGDLNIDKKILRNIMIFYLIFWGLAIIKLFLFKGKTCSKSATGEPGHLIWDHSKIFKDVPTLFKYLGLLLYYGSGILLFYMNNKTEGGIYGFLYFLSLFLSLSIAGKSLQWKSYWCWMVNLIPLAAIGIGYYYHRKKKSEEKLKK